MSVPTLFHPIELIKRKVKPLLKFFHLNNIVSKVGRPADLDNNTALALGLYQHQNGMPTKKAVYEQFKYVLPCSYKVFVDSLNRGAKIILALLLCLLRISRAFKHVVSHLDSTHIPVCKNKNARYHKTMAALASWGKTGEGWFYGIKLHLIADLLGKLQAVLFTSGHVSDKDKDTVLKLAQDITGIVIGDSGYVSEKLRVAFNRVDRILIAKPYKNMRVMATALQNFLYGTRMMIEKHFRVLKQFYGLVTSMPRSVTGYFANYFYALAAYEINQFQPPYLT